MTTCRKCGRPYYSAKNRPSCECIPWNKICSLCNKHFDSVLERHLHENYVCPKNKNLKPTFQTTGVKNENSID